MVSRELLQQFNDFLSNELGFYFQADYMTDFEKKVNLIAKSFNFNDVDKCIRWLSTASLDKEQVKAISQVLSVGETYFFRDNNIYVALRDFILPKIITNKHEIGRPITIWCPGCSTGEEPYSIAILIDRFFPALRSFTKILGTDINPIFIERARKGVYGEWSLRNTPKDVRDLYFTHSNGKYSLIPKVKENVTFDFHNIVQDQNPLQLVNEFDLAICANVLIYFRKQGIQKAISNIVNAIAPKGWLIVSQIEVPFVQNNHLKPYYSHGLTFFQKEILPKPAIKKVEPVKAATPKPPPPKINYIELYERKEYAKLEELLETYLENNPSNEKKNIELMVLLVNTYANQKKYDQARKWIETAIEMDKLDPSLHYILASILHDMGELENSMVQLKKSIFLHPKFVMANFQLATTLDRLGRNKDALKYYKNTLKILESYKSNEILPDSQGITASRIQEIIQKRYESLLRINE